MKKGAIAIIAFVACAGTAHAGAPDTMLRKSAQLLLEYAKEHGVDVGKELGKHVAFSFVVDGLKEVLIKKSEPPHPKKEEQQPRLDSESSELRRIRETLERMLADRAFLEQHVREREVIAHLERLDRCSNLSTANRDAAILACSEIIRSKEEPIEYIAGAYVNRGVAYGDNGDYGQEIKDVSKAIELNPRDPDAYYNRGSSYLHMGDYVQAIKDLSNAIELNPRDQDAYFYRGSSYSQMGDYAQAIKDFSKAIELNPRDTYAYYKRGFSYLRIDDYAQAIKDFSNAIEINPSLAEAYYGRGVAFESLGYKDKAIADYRSAFIFFGWDTRATGVQAALTRLGATP
jgi:tetratricopeptide (TPR) repeat protein